MEDISNENEQLAQSLQELAMDLHWTWNHATDKVWKQLNPVLWELTHNPLVVLQTVSRDRVAEVLQDPIVREIIEELVEAKRQRSIAPAWFQNKFPASPLQHVAFFSMEYMLSEALPIYSGGLGNVAGDLLKTASDLGVPLTGIGLLYQQGYARQLIYRDGNQQYVSPYNDPGQLPVTPLRTPTGEWLRIEIPLPGHPLWLRTWKVQVGRTSLFLLDSNDAANFPNHRGITAELYGSDPELRLLQEMILGMGGLRLLKALGMEPQVCHLNEGHAAFAVIERAAMFMRDNQQSFDAAFNATRSGNIFTTHTAVGAGFDRFDPALIQEYLGDYVNENLHIPLRDFLALGRADAANDQERFNTAYLAIRGSEYVNGVSCLHAEVSRRLFAGLFPGWPIREVPVSYVTNGVHMPSWDSPEADKLWTESCGKERWLGPLECLEKNMHAVGDGRLWTLRTERSRDLVEDIRERYSRQLATIGASAQEIEAAKELFDPGILTLGFARRFVPYKRTNLLLHDRARLHRLLSSQERPVQLVLAGKAHPADVQSRDMIREWIRFIQDYQLQHRVVFLSDYDCLLTEQMVQGVDVWINTPRRPWEACGTSGMKVLVNGGLNLSEMDGWWDEAFAPGVGWTFGDRREVDNDAVHDEQDATRLYEVLENEIVPLFYDRDENGLPAGWIGMMRNSMAQLTSKYSSGRALQEYTQDYYLPAAMLYRERSANRGGGGAVIAQWKSVLNQNWPGVHYGELRLEQQDGEYRFTVPLFLNGIPEDQVQVEIFADASGAQEAYKKPMKKMHAAGTGGEVLYYASAPADRPVHYYTPRIMPLRAGMAIPLECRHILWQH